MFTGRWAYNRGVISGGAYKRQFTVYSKVVFSLRSKHFRNIGLSAGLKHLSLLLRRLSRFIRSCGRQLSRGTNNNEGKSLIFSRKIFNSSFFENSLVEIFQVCRLIDSQAVTRKNCALLVKSMKFCMERPFYIVNGCRCGATEKNRFFPSYDDF